MFPLSEMRSIEPWRWDVHFKDLLVVGGDPFCEETIEKSSFFARRRQIWRFKTPFASRFTAIVSTPLKAYEHGVGLICIQGAGTLQQQTCSYVEYSMVNKRERGWPKSCQREVFVTLWVWYMLLAMAHDAMHNVHPYIFPVCSQNV